MLPLSYDVSRQAEDSIDCHGRGRIMTTDNGPRTLNRRSGKGSLLVVLLLFVAFASLGAYPPLNKDRYQGNVDLLQELQKATLGASETPFGQPGDWPQWRGPLRDGVARDVKLLPQWPERGPRIVWQAPMGL